MGDGTKFDHKVKPFPLQPPALVADDEEYGEFVLPDPEEMDEKEKQIQGTVDNIWEEFDSSANGYLEKDEAIQFIKKTLMENNFEVENEDEAI